MKKVFISYSHKDKDWVSGWLLPKLDIMGSKLTSTIAILKLGLPAL